MQVELLRNPARGPGGPGVRPAAPGAGPLRACASGRANKAERRQVRIGTRRPGEVEIVEGLAAGDRVITHGSDKVRPGQAVRIQAHG